METQQTNNSTPDYIEMYQNRVQALVNIIDPNKLFAVIGRGGGKTSHISTRRILRVAQEMPRETSIISHKSFVALFTNVIPTILESFRTEAKMPDGTERPMLIEGWDYVVGGEGSSQALSDPEVSAPVSGAHHRVRQWFGPSGGGRGQGRLHQVEASSTPSWRR